MRLRSWVRPDPAGGASSVLLDPIAGGGGLAAPSLRTQPPLSALGLILRFSAIRASVRPSQLQFLSTPMPIMVFLRATAGTAIARLSHPNSVRLSVCPSVTRVDQAKTVQARIIKSSPSAVPKTLVSGFVTLFQKFHRGHPNRGP